MGINSHMITSKSLTAFVKVAEGKHLDETTGLHAAYEDEIGTGQPWTIGYGHTTQSGITISGVLNGKRYDGEEVVQGLLIDEEEAERLLRITIERKANIVREAIQVPLSQNQFDALVDMAYNLGGKPFRKGSDILAALNGGVDDNNIPIGPRDYDRVADEFLRWGKAQGRPLQALHSRRIAAALLWKSLPWQWPLYNPAITLATSLQVAEDTASEMQDMPVEALKPRSTYARIVAAVDTHTKKEAPQVMETFGGRTLTLPENWETMNPSQQTAWLNGDQEAALKAAPVVGRKKVVDVPNIPTTTEKLMEDSETHRGLSKKESGRESTGAGFTLTAVATGSAALAGVSDTAKKTMENTTGLIGSVSLKDIITIAFIVGAGLVVSGLWRWWRGAIIAYEGRQNATQPKV